VIAAPGTAISASATVQTRAAADVGGEWHDESMPSSAPSAVMVGREAELSVVRGLFERAVDGIPVAALVEGEAGIGKSRLLREFTAETSARDRLSPGHRASA
jgi:predicted ATP-dependent serine protease